MEKAVKIQVIEELRDVLFESSDDSDDLTDIFGAVGALLLLAAPEEYRAMVFAQVIGKISLASKVAIPDVKIGGADDE